MSRLFWKIFLLFWAAMTLSGLALMGLALTTDSHPRSVSRQTFDTPGAIRFAFPFPTPLFRPFWAKLLVTSLVSGAICYALTRHLCSPITLLRSASLRLASGDLSVRVAPDLGRRRDELGDLAADFDTMAARIDELLLAHKNLLRDVSHELRSPLARMNVALELLSQGEANEQDLITRLHYETGELNRLIGQILRLSRLESCVDRATFRPVNLSALLDTLVADAGFESGPQKRAISLQNASPLWIHGSGEILHSALDNLIRNALCHTPPESSVELSCAPCETSTKLVRLRIRDHGPGVPPSQLPRLFQPFFRSEAGRGGHHTGGFGLGLAIAKQAVLLHGGQISAANAPGGGLEITLWLPTSAGARHTTMPSAPT